MNFGVSTIGQRIDQAKTVFARIRIELVEQDGVGGTIFASQFQLRVAEDDLALVRDAEVGADLQNDSGSIVAGFVGSGFASF
jgi:hypothetical protein